MEKENNSTEKTEKLRLKKIKVKNKSDISS